MTKKPQSPGRRKGRAGEDPEDAFIARTLEFWAWAKQNRQVLVVVGLALALAIGAGLYYYDYRRNLRLQAAEEFEALQQTVATANPESAQNEIRRFIERFSDTPFGIEARLLLAQTHLETGAPAEAVSVLEPVSRDLSQPMGVQAAFLLCAAYENAGRPEDAEASYLRIADASVMTFQRRQALADAARIRAAREDFAGAADLYQRLLDTYEEDQEEAEARQRAFYRARLAEMRSAIEG